MYDESCRMDHEAKGSAISAIRLGEMAGFAHLFYIIYYPLYILPSSPLRHLDQDWRDPNRPEPP